MTTQPLLFGDRIDAEFSHFLAQNPHVYSAVVRLAREAKDAGFPCGIATIWERLRWHYGVEIRGGTFRLNNNYRSRMARLVMDNEPDLRGFFEIRELRAAA